MGDTAYFGPEPEFFVFDSITWGTDMSGCFVKIKSEEAAWASAEEFEGGNTGHRPGVKGGYFPVPPVDSAQDLRSAMVLLLEELGVPVEVHHHEVATAGQMEIGTKFSTLTQRADWTQILKYVVQNVAHSYGKTATFMPKPIVGDNGSGMHTARNLFAGDGYAGLSETALYYIGGIIKHAKALNAITNPGTNSYKRLVPHYEAPHPKGRRIEARFPDPLANPYLCFSALLMAGLDGIQNKIHPGDAADKNLYDLPPEEDKLIPTVCASLDEALAALDADRDFLTRGGVFSNEWIDSYIELKMQEVNLTRMTTHPVEFAMYYSLLAQAEVYKYIDANGNVTFTNVPIKGAKPMHLAPLSTYGTSSKSKPASSAGGKPASTPDGYPNVDNGTQNKRDQGRRKILESELANEQKALADAQKAYTDGAATRNGDETRNYQKYLDRVQKLKDAVTERQKNVDALRRELGQATSSAQ
uniref:GS catalytic domain-containing protein n=1 Tax=Anopheles coluzzii TaxID=1518534 RepID=A0A8W7P2P3_ANOCL